MVQNSTTPSSENDQPATGKGRPTPSRAEREAANRRPLAPDTKEARKEARSALNANRDKARAGMAAGEEKYLPPRDKGEQRRWGRDYVDAGWHLGEFVMPAMIVVIILTFVPNYVIQTYSFLVLWAYILLVIGDMVLLSRRVKKKTAAKWGSRVEKGHGWYASMRSFQMRFMRLPKPQVKRGQYPA